MPNYDAAHHRPTAPIERYRRIGFAERLGKYLRALPLAGAPRRLLRRAYHAALMLQAGGRGLSATLPGGETVRFLPEYRYLSWNPDEYAAFRRAVRPGDTVLDIGANVGAYTLPLAHWVGDAGRVHAFEPAPGPCDGLVRHVALNRLDARVQVVRAAVTDRAGSSRLIVASAPGQNRLASPHETSADATEVAATTVDEYCRAHDLTPAFIKIDVEGFELAVLRGARQTIARGGDGLSVFVELHPGLWPALGIDRGDLLAELRAQQLHIEPIAPVNDVWLVDGICVRLVRDRHD